MGGNGEMHTRNASSALLRRQAACSSFKTPSIAPAFIGCMALLIASYRVASAVIYDVPGGLISAPVDDRGWSETGSWQGGGGVAIAPDYFLTAHHLGGSAGQPFVLNGVTYSTSAMTDVPGTDLRLVQIVGSFPSFTAIDHQPPGSEVTQPISLVGFGHYTHGTPLITNSIQNGWFWGSATGKNFAMNTVKAITTTDVGPTLDFTFDPLSGQNEGIYTLFDSGGGAFVLSNGKWRLAGVAYSITSFYQHSGDANYLPAAIYNSSGLYTTDQSGNYVAASGPQHGYASEVAASWQPIDRVLLPGDLNYDAKVDFSDLVTLASHYGTTKGASYVQGDINGDGRVDFSDLVLLAGHYGQDLDAGATAIAIADIRMSLFTSSSPIPEPALVGVICVGAQLLRRTGRSRRRLATVRLPGFRDPGSVRSARPEPIYLTANPRSRCRRSRRHR